MSRILVAVISVFFIVSVTHALVPAAQAQGPTVDEIKAIYGGLTAAQAVARGYQADPFCIDGRIMGMPEMGTMGFHYVKPALIDTVVDPANPEVLLVFGDKVVGMEFMLPVGAPGAPVPASPPPAPSLFGQKFNGPMSGHGPGQPPHYDLHVWFVTNPSGQFADFNPALAPCPAGTLPPAGPPGAPPAGDAYLPYALGAMALLGLLALGAGVRLARARR